MSLCVEIAWRLATGAVVQKQDAQAFAQAVAEARAAAAKQTKARLIEVRDELVSAYRPERAEVERRRWRCWRLRLPGGARLQLAGLDCPVLVAPHAMPYCLDSLRRGCGFACPAAEPSPCLAAAAWLLGGA